MGWNGRRPRRSSRQASAAPADPNAWDTTRRALSLFCNRSPKCGPARDRALPHDARPTYDSYVTYVVIHGSDEKPTEQAADTLGGATRLALAYMREHRKNVRVQLPSGRTMTFESFQEAIFQGDLRD